MTQKLFTVVLLLAVALTVCYAKCDCDAQDQDCVRKCVTDADVCITNCKGDTTCYEGCIGNKWPTDESIHVQYESASPMATTAAATHSTASHSSVSASSTHHSSTSATATSKLSSASPSSTSAAAPSLLASLYWPAYALATAAYFYLSS